MCGKRVSNFAHCVASEVAAKNRTTAAKIHCATLKKLRRVSAKNLLVYLRVAPRGRFRREGRECVESSCPAQLAAATVSRQQIVEGARQRSSVACFHEQAGLLVLDHVAQTAGIERDDRRLAEQRFDGDETESFVDRRYYDRRRPL